MITYADLLALFLMLIVIVILLQKTGIITITITREE